MSDALVTANTVQQSLQQSKKKLKNLTKKKLNKPESSMHNSIDGNVEKKQSKTIGKHLGQNSVACELLEQCNGHTVNGNESHNYADNGNEINKIDLRCGFVNGNDIFTHKNTNLCTFAKKKEKQNHHCQNTTHVRTWEQVLPREQVLKTNYRNGHGNAITHDGITLRNEHKTTKINAESQQISIKPQHTDKIIISTGAIPKKKSCDSTAKTKETSDIELITKSITSTEKSTLTKGRIPKVQQSKIQTECQYKGKKLVNITALIEQQQQRRQLFTDSGAAKHQLGIVEITQEPKICNDVDILSTNDELSFITSQHLAQQTIAITTIDDDRQADGKQEKECYSASLECAINTTSVTDPLSETVSDIAAVAITETTDAATPLKSNIQIEYTEYEAEHQMHDIMRLIQAELSEPYSIYTYRYFIYNWPKLCFLARHGNEYVGAIVCKLDMHMNVRRGYIAMLAVRKEYRKLKIGTTLVQKAIDAMLADNADEVVLETEMRNVPALRLYENLGFVRDKRLFRYYLNGVDALRLKLWFR